MKTTVKTQIIILLISLSFLPTKSMAQSVTILGQSEDARECFMSAEMAIRMQITSRSEIQSCTSALLTQNLRLRDKAATYINRGILYAAAQEYDKAIRDYATAKKLYPEFGAIHVNRGNLFFIGESYDSAITEYSKALDLGLRQDYVAFMNRGMAYEHLGRYTEAEADYREAITLAPDWKEPQSKLARVLLKIN